MAVDRIVLWYEIIRYLFQTTLTFKVCYWILILSTHNNALSI